MATPDAAQLEDGAHELLPVRGLLTVAKRKAGGSRARYRWVPRNVLLTGGFFLLSMVVLFLTVKLLSPFAKGLIWAVVIAILAFPVFRLVLRFTGRRRSLASMIVTASITIGGLVPSVALLAVLARESRAAYLGLIEFVKSDRYRDTVERIVAVPGELLPGLDDTVTAQIEIWSKDAGTATLNVVAEFLGRTLNMAIGNLPMLVLNVVIVFVAVFYFLRDGELWLRKFKEILPLEPRVRDLVMSRFTTTLWAVMHGMLLTAVAQAAILSVGLWLFGVPLPVFLGMIAFFASLIPVIGPTIIWIPAAGWLYFSQDDPGRAIGLACYGLFLVSAIDTILRPYIIGERMRLPFLLLILAVVGGLMAYGALGLFLGPVLVAVGLGVARVYRDMTVRERSD